MIVTEDEKKVTAIHEAGHALLGMLLPHADPLHKVTIVPRGMALGLTMSLPTDEKHNYSKNYLVDQIGILLGGRIAEEITMGSMTTGAGNDLERATDLARKMVCEWGMSEKLGMVEYGDHEEHVFLGRDLGRDRAYSEATAQEIDREVKKLCDDGYNRALQLITANKDKVEMIAKALLEFETLDGAQVKDIALTGTMKNPPPPPTGGSAKPLTPMPPIPMDKPADNDPKPGIDFPGGLSGAPA
jgi:cell division protease FtsH